MDIKFGLEFEFILKDKIKGYLDYTNLEYSLLSNIINKFPLYKFDNKIFDCKSLEKYPKRVYIEGFENYNIEGKINETIPKCLEIRTKAYTNIDELLNEFLQTYKNLFNILNKYQLVPLFISSHPFKTLNDVKKEIEIENSPRTEYNLNLALNAMLLHGIHISFSIKNSNILYLESIVEKLNYYLPFLIPFSFSSPFYKGKISEYLSYRNYQGSTNRKLVSIKKRKDGNHTIEFGAYDCVNNLELLKALIILIKGVVLSRNLKEFSKIQRVKLIQFISNCGLNNDKINNKIILILEQVKKELTFDEIKSIDILYKMLNSKFTPSNEIIERYKKMNSIVESISNMYKF
jgi:hypothetical protein